MAPGKKNGIIVGNSALVRNNRKETTAMTIEHT